MGYGDKIMSIRQIEEAKVLRKHCEKLGRQGIAERIIQIAEKIAHRDGGYIRTMRLAGQIRALCVGSKCDSYWDEKQDSGFHDIYWEANKETHDAQ